jgi:glucokinase
MTLLLADIGGTNTRCALTGPDGAPLPAARFRNEAYAGIVELLSAYLASVPARERPRGAALSIAAPIRGDHVHMTNIDWSFSIADLQRQLRLATLEVVNDFAALAWALPALGPGDVVQIGGGAPSHGPRVVLGPGTGLGVATLVPCAGASWHVIPGEGGHVTLPAQDEGEAAIVRQVRERFGHCSAERLLSGPGLSLLHALLHGESGLAPEAIGDLARNGNPNARATFETFFRLLGTVASDVAITVGAAGGVYVAGGIVPKYLDAFRQSGFRERFEAKGRYRDYQRAIPTWVITSADPALVGLAAMAGYRSA